MLRKAVGKGYNFGGSFLCVVMEDDESYTKIKAIYKIALRIYVP
ncbi:hypothetical protein ACFL1G_01570 [Planctomycetota bacterium]